jgi:hypothetical protein
MRIQPRKFLFFSFVIVILSASLSGCSTAKQSAHLNMASMDKMPADVQVAPVSVQQAYQFAVANPDVLQKIPCFCGCGKIGHKSNYSCYVQGVDDKSKVTFDDHAMGCSLCVDITQDTMRLMQQGKSPQEIRTYVDATYTKYGSSNIQP